MTTFVNLTSQLYKAIGFLFLLGALVFSAYEAQSKTKNARKTQEVNFDGADIDGVVRSPDGAYLVQKRGVEFVPLYDVKKKVDHNIKESVEYLR